MKGANTKGYVQSDYLYKILEKAKSSSDFAGGSKGHQEIFYSDEIFYTMTVVSVTHYTHLPKLKIFTYIS